MKKAQEIIEQLENGVHFSSMQGRRMTSDKSIISIPVNYSYRIVARETDCGLQIKYVVSHETYNKLIKKR